MQEFANANRISFPWSATAWPGPEAFLGKCSETITVDEPMGALDVVADWMQLDGGYSGARLVDSV